MIHLAITLQTVWAFIRFDVPSRGSWWLLDRTEPNIIRVEASGYAMARNGEHVTIRVPVTDANKLWCVRFDVKGAKP
jgi:hypothetical protein